MSYNTRVTYDELRREAEQIAQQAEQLRVRMVKAYDKYISFAAGRTAVELAAAYATAEDTTEAEFTDLAALFQTGQEFDQWMRNQPTSQGDRRFAMVKFF